MAKDDPKRGRHGGSSSVAEKKTHLSFKTPIFPEKKVKDERRRKRERETLLVSLVIVLELHETIIYL